MKKTEERKSFPVCTDIYRENDFVIVKMEMPGVAKEDLDIKVDNDKLIVDGLKKINYPKGEFRLKEIRDCDYHHEFNIDQTIDRNSINAEIKNGIVTLKLGIKESEKPRKIKVISK
jgi:HSP20 family protein